MNFSFRILGITRGNQNVDTEEQVDTPILTFVKGDIQRYSLRISEYIDEQTRQIAATPEGNYQLQVIFSIIESGKTKSSERPRSRKLKAEASSISYKKNSN